MRNAHYVTSDRNVKVTLKSNTHIFFCLLQITTGYRDFYLWQLCYLKITSAGFVQPNAFIFPTFVTVCPQRLDRYKNSITLYSTVILCLFYQTTNLTVCMWGGIKWPFVARSDSLRGLLMRGSFLYCWDSVLVCETLCAYKLLYDLKEPQTYEWEAVVVYIGFRT